MGRLEPLSPANLAENIHLALKQWGKTTDAPGPLNHLCLFQAALRAGDKSAAQVTNEILDDALKTLETTSGTREVDLLRMRFYDQATVSEVAIRYNIVESTAHKKQREAIEHLAAILYERERQVRDEILHQLEWRLALPARTPLIGAEQSLNELWKLLKTPDSAWVIAVEGLGGVGKTALANVLLREIVLTAHFYDVAWVSARQQEFWPDLGLRETRQPALNNNTLADALLEQLGDEAARSCPPQQKLAILSELLKKQPYLVVIDNLETVADYEALLPLLLKLANPSKFLLTSRYRPPHPDVTHFKVKPLSRTDTHTFLKNEAKVRRLPALAAASPAQLDSIHEVVGGNPLALKLVAGQIHALPLSRVLDNLRQARSRPIDELYTYIYWQTWQTLDAAARQTLIVMPLAQNGVLDDIARESELEETDLDYALQQLIALSLVEVSGDDLEQRRYHIHRLTETFLLQEVVKWQTTS